MRSLLRSIASLILILAVDASYAQDSRRFVQMIETHCMNCHDGDLDSDSFSIPVTSANAIASHTKIWESVLRKIQARQMPPVGEPRPSESEYRELQAYLARELASAAGKNPNPGRTDTFRRLTRFEYSNAIRDLFGLEVDVSTLLPKDEVSHGFDNITVGELSPALLNRYVSSAQWISRLAVGAGTYGSGSRTIRVRPDITQEHHVEGLPLGTRGGVLIPFNVPVDGKYQVAVRLMRDRNEHIEGLKKQHELEVILDRRRIAVFTIKPPRSDNDHVTADQHLRTVIELSAGPHELGATFLRKPLSLIETKRQPYEARVNFHRSPRQTPAVYEVSLTELEQSDEITETPSRRRLLVSRPSETKAANECAQQILRPLLRKAYRRPVTEADFVQPMAFFRQTFPLQGFDVGIEDALSAILVNPNFLFRIERDPVNKGDKSPYRISDVELASRLSFFLWSSLPDEELLGLAQKNVLHEPRVLADQVGRMLADVRAESLVTSFAGQWLYLRNLDTLTPDGRLFPDFDHNLREAFRKETESFFRSVMREDQSVLKLLRSDYTFLNERLAKHYGIPHIYGSRFRRVALSPDSHRGGLLRHGSILTVTSYATRTSPVIRGNWILENIVGAPPPPPPDDVPALEDNTVNASLSVRERLAAHRANPACASCHNLMDPVGFALENYDAVGRWRDLEAGRPVDASGGLPDGSEFVGVNGLEAGLLQRPELFVGTLTEKLLTYALGRGVEYFDGPAIRRIVSEAAKDDYRFSAIVRGIVSSVPFQMRMPE